MDLRTVAPKWRLQRSTALPLPLIRSALRGPPLLLRYNDHEHHSECPPRATGGHVNDFALHRKPSSGEQSHPRSGCGNTSAPSPRRSASSTGRGPSSSSRRRSSSWTLRRVQRRARWCASACREHRVLPFTMQLECVQGHGEGSRPDAALCPEVLPDADATAGGRAPDTDSSE